SFLEKGKSTSEKPQQQQMSSDLRMSLRPTKMDQKEEARKILGEEGSSTEDDLHNIELRDGASSSKDGTGVYTQRFSYSTRTEVRATWMPQGETRKKLEEEKGIVIRFVIGHG
ncbi:hypothetical protein BHE74_00009758, partial [Ensete ventricosum]